MEHLLQGRLIDRLPSAAVAGRMICGQGPAQEKLAVMEERGIKVTKNPAEMGRLLKSVLK